MSETADIVIVGAGIMGLSIAHQISRRDDSSIVVLNKALNVAEGSTGASCAILRQRYTHPESVTAARDGLKAHRNWSAYTGLPEPRAQFHHTGVLWMMWSRGGRRDHRWSDRQAALPCAQHLQHAFRSDRRGGARVWRARCLLLRDRERLHRSGEHLSGPARGGSRQRRRCALLPSPVWNWETGR